MTGLDQILGCMYINGDNLRARATEEENRIRYSNPQRNKTATQTPPMMLYYLIQVKIFKNNNKNLIQVRY